jgi:hydroxyethylthiazole kinase-like uncharacterized protein yjeF
MPNRFLSIAQIRHIEADAVAKFKLNLMDTAGAKIALWVKNNRAKTDKILVLVGRGNNGGDGVIAANYLLKGGYAVNILATAEQLNPTTESLIHDFKKNGGRVLAKTPSSFNGFDVIIDAILGIGITRNIDSKLSDLINLVNQSQRFILSVDTPTGLDPFSGEVFGNAIRANHTITFISDKPGFYTGFGIDLVGKVSIEQLVNLDDFDLAKAVKPQVLSNDLTTINYSPLVRKTYNTNKGTFGSVVIIGGNVGMHGALYLAGRAAMLCGSGKVILCPLDKDFGADLIMPELMQAKPKDVLKNIDGYSVVVVGPGFGQDEVAVNFLNKLLRHKSQTKFIFDADALNLIAATPELQAQFKLLANKIITPHPGEVARLLKTTLSEINRNRFKALNSMKVQFDAITLIKGAGSLIEDNHNVYLNQTGNMALSNAGQGDTLCGIIAAFVAQGMDLSNALRFAVYLHGKSSESLAVSIGYNGVLATEIALTVRNLLNQLLYS